MSESVREAFVRGVYKWGPSPEEQELQAFAMRIIKRDSEGWHRAMARIQASSQEAFEILTAERLRATGKNAALAPVIVAALLSAISYLVAHTEQNGRFTASAKDLDAVLRELAETLLA